MFRFTGGRENLFQWDVNVRLFAPRKYIRVDFLKGEELLSVKPEETEGGCEVIVPNQLLTEPGHVYVFGAMTEDAALYTMEKGCFRVIERERPADYVLEPTEVETFASLTADVRTAITETNRAIEAADQAAEDAAGIAAEVQRQL